MGDTRRAIDLAFPKGSIELVTLSDLQIGSYDYAHSNDCDDFQSVVEKMLATNTVVFATPVYWYAMSGNMKVFFDRLTDLLETSKERGRQMAGKSIWLIASGVELTLPEGFEVPFERTAQYFAMRYMEAAYLFSGESTEARQSSERTISLFGQKILSSI